MRIIALIPLVFFLPWFAVPTAPATWDTVMLSPVVEAGEGYTSEFEVEPETFEAEPETVENPWTEEEVTALAKMVWGEARGIASVTEQAACVWCVLNRVDSGFGSIVQVVTAPCQFAGYRGDNPVDEDIAALCEDVLSRWYAEKAGENDIGRVLPSDYLWFSGDGSRNYFRNIYRGGTAWDWSLESPYES